MTDPQLTETVLLLLVWLRSDVSVGSVPLGHANKPAVKVAAVLWQAINMLATQIKENSLISSPKLVA